MAPLKRLSSGSTLGLLALLVGTGALVVPLTARTSPAQAVAEVDDQAAPPPEPGESDQIGIEMVGVDQTGTVPGSTASPVATKPTSLGSGSDESSSPASRSRSRTGDESELRWYTTPAFWIPTTISIISLMAAFWRGRTAAAAHKLSMQANAREATRLVDEARDLLFEDPDSRGLERARRLILEAEDLSAKSPEVRVAWASYYIEKKQLGAATRELEKALKSNARFDRAHNQKGRLLAREGDLEGALASFDQAIALEEDECHAHVNKGAALFNEDRFEEALEVLNEGIEKEATNWVAHANRGLVLRSLGRLVEAKDSLRIAVKLCPTSTSARSNLGGVLMDCEEHRDARIHLEEAVRLAPSDASALANLGVCLAELGIEEEARTCFEQVASLAPNDAVALRHLGQTELSLQDYDAAERHLSEAIRLGVEHELDAKLALADAMRGLQSYSDAARLVEGALEEDPEKPGARAFLAELQRSSGDLSSALSNARIAWAENPDDASTGLLLGDLLFRHRRFLEAESILTPVLQPERQHQGGWNTLGLCRTMEGDHEAALRCYLTAGNLGPGEIAPWANAGAALFELGRFDEAAHYADKALAIDPSYPVATRLHEALARLRDEEE